jgi:outer membrane protein insertion porin family
MAKPPLDCIRKVLPLCAVAATSWLAAAALAQGPSLGAPGGYPAAGYGPPAAPPAATAPAVAPAAPAYGMPPVPPASPYAAPATPVATDAYPAPMSGAPGMALPPDSPPVSAVGPNAARPADNMVVEVRVEGNRGVALDKIVPHIKTRAGRPYDNEIIAEDVRRLHKTGWFVTIRPLSKPVAGGVLVIFQLVERPIIKEVHVIGPSDIAPGKLKKESGVKVGDAADPFAVEEGRRKIEEFYQKKGYAKVRVTIREGNKPGDLRVIYVVDEGPKQKIWKVNVVGSQVVSEGHIKWTQLQSKPPILWLFKGEVNYETIDEDVKHLTAYYRDMGFFDAKIGREIEFNDKSNWATLTFVVSEGQRYLVRNINFIGNTKLSNDQLADNTKLKPGEFFNRQKLLSDTTTIQDKYGAMGYAFAKVEPDNHRFLDRPGEIDLVYKIDEGDRYRIGKINIEIKGENPHTKLTPVLNRLSFKPGDPVDTREMRASERRLKASGLFMVDMQKGAAPKITIVPPELGDKDKRQQLAEDPDRPVYRGQAPDGTPTTTWTLRPEPQLTANGVRTVDLNVQVEADDDDADLPPPPAQPDPRAMPQAPGAYPAAQAAPLIIRGQYTTADGAPDTAMPYASSTPPGAPAYGPVAPAAPAPVYATPTAPAPVYTTPAAPAPVYATPGVTPLNTAPAYAAPGIAPVPQPQPGGLQWVPPGTAAPPQPYDPYPPRQVQRVYSAPQGYGYSAPAPGLAPGTQGIGPLPPQQLPANDPVFGDFLGPPVTGEPLRDLEIRVQQEETQTGRLMFGVGVNSDAGLVGSIVLDEQNFDWTRWPTGWEDIRNATAWRGAGQRFRIEAVPGTQVQRYTASWQEPYLMDTAVSLGLSGSYFQRYYDEWHEQRAGGRVALGYQFTHDLTGSFAFRGFDVDIKDPIEGGIPPHVPADLEKVLGHNTLYGFQFSLAHDTRDNAFLATEGHLIEASFEEVVGTWQYPHVELDWSQYFKLFERPDGSGRHVLSLSARMGITGDNTPIYDRYYAGGYSTIRGFYFRGVSPIDPSTGVRVGGNFELLGSIQYLFPITPDDMLRGVLFCDTGTVEPSIRQWDQNYRVAPGFGLRIAIPAMGPAPIALDFAFPVCMQSGDRREVFSFFMGFNR